MIFHNQVIKIASNINIMTTDNSLAVKKVTLKLKQIVPGTIYPGGL